MDKITERELIADMLPELDDESIHMVYVFAKALREAQTK